MHETPPFWTQLKPHQNISNHAKCLMQKLTPNKQIQLSDDNVFNSNNLANLDA